ncbi:MAG: PIG-L family deacetylase [Actinomycetota bacterium]|nr:PIG-L family deacetylase [Actinomycetota bacterium]
MAFAGAVIIIAILLLLAKPALLRGPTKATGHVEVGFPQIGDRLLVVAPHPDDESLAAAVLIHKALAQNKKVKLVIVTCGDGNRDSAIQVSGNASPTPENYRELGRKRSAETLKAMQDIGYHPMT